nr:hypothetical protein GCM10017547_38640 [Pseudarthrobacter oxydans]
MDDIRPVTPPFLEWVPDAFTAMACAFMFGFLLPYFIRRWQYAGSGNIWLRGIGTVGCLAAAITFGVLATGGVWPIVQVVVWVATGIAALCGIWLSRLFPE